MASTIYLRFMWKDFQKKYWRFFLAFLFLSGIGFFIYQIYQDSSTWSQLYGQLRNQLEWRNAHLLAICVLLMPMNWLLESVKWKTLLVPIRKISLRHACTGVLMGVSVSIFTPNRVGEYFGRVINIKVADRWKALSAQLLGSMIQLLALSVAGTLALVHLANSLTLPLGLGVEDMSIVVILCALILAGVLVTPQLLRRLISYIPNKWLTKMQEHVRFLHAYRYQELLSILLITLFRIGIYVLQYYLLLLFFGIHIAFKSAAAAILLTYCIQSVLPLPLVLGLLARGEITVLVWHFFDVNELALLSASYLLWVINVFVPALVGTRPLIRSDVKKMLKIK